MLVLLMVGRSHLFDCTLMRLLWLAPFLLTWTSCCMLLPRARVWRACVSIILFRLTQLSLQCLTLSTVVLTHWTRHTIPLCQSFPQWTADWFSWHKAGQLVESLRWILQGSRHAWLNRLLLFVPPVAWSKCSKLSDFLRKFGNFYLLRDLSMFIEQFAKIGMW